jgi:hypothetical protein
MTSLPLRLGNQFRLIVSTGVFGGRLLLLPAGQPGISRAACAAAEIAGWRRVGEPLCLYGMSRKRVSANVNANSQPKLKVSRPLRVFSDFSNQRPIQAIAKPIIIGPSIK